MYKEQTNFISNQLSVQFHVQKESEDKTVHTHTHIYIHIYNLGLFKHNQIEASKAKHHVTNVRFSALSWGKIVNLQYSTKILIEFLRYSDVFECSMMGVSSTNKHINCEASGLLCNIYCCLLIEPKCHRLIWAKKSYLFLNRYIKPFINRRSGK